MMVFGRVTGVLIVVADSAGESVDFLEALRPRTKSNNSKSEQIEIETFSR